MGRGVCASRREWSRQIEADKVYELDLLVLEGVLALKGKKSSVHLKDIMKTYSKQKEPVKSSQAGGSKKSG